MDMKGEKIRLRLMNGQDTDLIVNWRNNPRVRNNFIYQKPFTREGHENWVRTMVDTGKVVQFIRKAPLAVYFLVNGVGRMTGIV